MKTIRLLKSMLLAMLMLAGFGVRAQDVGLDWAKAFQPANTTSDVRPYGVGTDANGNVYVSGHFNGTADFNPGAGVFNLTSPSAAGIFNASAFFVKLDKYGNFIWAKQIGAALSSVTAYAIKVDAAGNIYAVGEFGQTIDFNPNAGVNNLTSAAGSADGYILKLDTNGNYVWAQRMGGGASESGYDVDVDAAGNVFVVGYIGSGTSTFGPGTTFSVTSAGGNDGFAAKLNPSGAFQWVRRIGSTGFDTVDAVDVDAAGNVYIGGPLAGNTTGMATLGAGGFVIKLNTSGTTQWSYSAPDPGRYRGVAVDSDGNVYAAGTGTDKVVKLNSSGTRVWAKKLGTWVYKLKVGPDNNVYTTGYYDGAATNFGSFTLPATGDKDVFAAGLNAAGDVLWAKPFGGAGEDLSYYLSADVSGEVLVTGNFQQTVDFDPSSCVFNLTTTSTPGDWGGYVFKLTSNALPPDFAVASSTIAPLTQQACSLGIPNVITGSAVGITAPTGYNTTIGYQWQKSTSATGPWEDMPGEVFKDLQPLASSESLFYRRLIKAETKFCGVFQTMDSSAVASVTIGTNTAPSANADGPQWFVCAAGTNTVALSGSAAGGSGSFTYQWYQGSTNGGTLVASTANYTTTPVTQATTYTLKVTDAAGCIDTDQVTIVPAVANAGPNVSFCQGSGGVQIGTAPVASPSVKYAWTRVSGDPIASLSCTTCAQPIADPAAVTIYRLTVTTTKKDGTTCTTTDDVTITPVTAPGNVLAFGGPDKTICVNSNTVLGVATDATYTYTWSPGQFLNNTAIAKPTFTAGSSGIDPCSVNYTVTAVKSGCAFVDEVKVSVINSETADSGDTECGPRWVTHEGFPNCPEAVYTWSIVSGNGVILSTRNGGEDAYLKSNVGTTKFRRSVTLNGVTCFSDVDIYICGDGCDVEIETISSQGCPKVFPGEQLRLAPKNVVHPDEWNYQWSPAHLVDNPTAKEVNVLTSSPATLTLTITNKFDASLTCSESIDLNPAGATQPTIVLNDKSICFNTPTAIGSPVSGGFKYTWTPSTGLSSTSVNNPMATLTEDQEYIVEIEDTQFGCKMIDTVKVTVAQVVADAGIDRAICNGATVTLGAPAPANTNWTYSWQPSGAAWTNGTNATMPQPQVEFSATGNQVFRLTVTDPASGCMAMDSVTLKNDLTPGEYTGSSVTICEGEEIQLGKDPIPGASYLWTGPGLSCTTCSNPVATPTSTTTYNLQISYPGCSAPMMDAVTVTVNEIPEVALKDVYACAAGPVAIGFGAGGNPAAPAGATYLWSPSQGLSSATAANPTANVTVHTTYAVVVTLPSGCSFTDELDVIPTSASAGSDAAICSGEATQIGNPAIPGATYAWTGAGIVGAANVAQPTVKPAVTTTYSVTVTLNGCPRTDQVVVTVNTPAAFNISGNTTICVGGSTTLSLVGSPAPNTTWQWSPTIGVSNPTGTSTTVTTAQTQTYRLTQTNLTTGCSNFKEVVVVVKPNTISASTTPLAVCDGVATALPLTVISTGSYQYVWSPSTGLSNAFVATPTVTTSTNKNYNVVITDTQSQCQLALSVPVTVRPGTECLPPVALRGNVFHDANALKDVTVNKTVPTPIPTLYVSLLDTIGTVLETVPVNADGSYDFGLTAAGTYNIALHQNLAGSATPNLPAGWMNTGENLGAGVGSDAGVNGILTTVTVRNVDVTDANFGIQQPPLAEPKIYIIDQPVVNQEIPLNSTLVSTGAGTSSPAQMTGTDPEDGILTGANKDKTVVIITLADRGELWYNGVLVKTGQVIPNYDPALMIFKATGLGYTNITYEYAYKDQAGVQSPPTTYKISWGKPLPVTLVRFEAKAVEHAAQLSWTTTAESNSDRFEVERSLNGKKWEKIGTVNAQGESAATVDYSFRDLTPAGSDNYYRLKMIDRDLTFTYSGIRSVSFEVAFETSIFPNPAADKVNLKVTDWKKVASVKINNLAGVNVYQSGRITSEVIDVKSLPQGTYILVVTHVDGSFYSHKLVHIK
ncbi:SBBP repeat-containing protein [Dyadobacter sp. 22481]|uniref:Ig-like domain-containing protein n=1 Tax=Dyadobacter sp. 22481 TaxID=3453926 RepID=UPI003F854D26